MTDTSTPNLLLPVIEADQAQKHVTANHAFLAIDALLQLAVQTRNLSTPPDYPLDGERWIVGPSADGVWANEDNNIAAYQDNAWTFYVPRPGWQAYCIEEDLFLTWTGSFWKNDGAATWNGGLVVETMNVAATMDIGISEGTSIVFHGTSTSISSLGSVPNRIRYIYFDGNANTLVHSAALSLPGGIDIVTAAGDSAIAISDPSGNWRLNYTYAGATAEFYAADGVSNGVTATPSYTFGTDTNTGFLRFGTDTIGFAAGGYLVATLSYNYMTFNGDSLYISTGGTLGIKQISCGMSDSAPRYLDFDFSSIFTVTGEFQFGRYTSTSGGISTKFYRGNNTTTYDHALYSGASGTVAEFAKNGGNATFGGNITATGILFAGNGTAGAPTFSFASDTNVGMYRIGADEIGFAVNGALVLDIATTGVVITGNSTASGLNFTGNGAAATPSYSFGSDTNTGMYRIGADEIGLAVNGTLIFDLTTTGISITGNMIASGVASLANGAAATPSYSFTGDLDTGMYHIGANNLGFAVNGAKALDISTTYATFGTGLAIGVGSTSQIVNPLDNSSARTLDHEFTGLSTLAGAYRFGRATNTSGGISLEIYRANNTATLDHALYSGASGTVASFALNGGNVTFGGNASAVGILFAGNGTAGAPTFSFTSDTNTGMYRIGADEIGLAVNGTLIFDLTTTGIAVTGNVTASGIVFAGNGAVGTPSYAFGSDTNTGMYRIGADEIGLAVGGTLIADIASTGMAITGTLSATGVITSNAGLTVTTGGATLAGTNTNAILWIKSSSNAAISNGNGDSGVNLTAIAATANRFTPSIKFGFTDTDLTTTNPKFGALIVGYATETYAADTAGGMGLCFFTTPNAPGTGNALTLALKIDDGQNATFSGEIITAASATSGAGFRLPHGAAPTSPVNGDMWSTTAGLFIRINGVTKTVTLT